jgi:hypothetical protein
MTKRVLAATLILVLVLLLGLALLSQREPRYQGKSLTEWSQQYGSNHWGVANREAGMQAESAIREIGTNGIPFLLNLIRTRDFAVKKRLRAFVPQAWQTHVGLRDNSEKIRRTGAHGLAALGTNAGAAVPDLIDVATHHPESDGRYTAVFALRTLGSAAEPAIPLFIQCLTNKVATIRDEAAVGLGTVHRQPEIVVPALIRYLEFIKNSPARTFEYRDAIQSLAQFGNEAKPAVPTLLSLLDDPHAEVREAITNWLWKIDAQAASNAHVIPRR